MFGCFKRNREVSTPSAPESAPVAVRFREVEVEVADLTVAFTLIGGAVSTREFVTNATFNPAISDRDDGVAIHDADCRLQGFMERWHKNGFAVVDDGVVRFSDFMRATIARKKRMVCVRVRVRFGAA